MKITKLYFLAGLAFLISCGEHAENGESQTTQFDAFGEQITEENAIESSALASQLEGKDTVRVKLKTQIKEVCQKKGCWMNVAIGQEDEMTVRFKDYGFFVPKDAAGKEVIFEGLAFRDTTSVADLRHYAEDAGKTPEEIEKITEPEVSLGFEASGVIIRR